MYERRLSEMSQIQHGAARDRKVNKNTRCCFFKYDHSFGPAQGIIKTEQTSGPLGLRYSPPRRVVKSLGLPVMHIPTGRAYLFAMTYLST